MIRNSSFGVEGVKNIQASFKEEGKGRGVVKLAGAGGGGRLKRVQNGLCHSSARLDEVESSNRGRWLFYLLLMTEMENAKNEENC